MGKNKKSKIVYKTIEVDSLEEWQFFCWLDEAKELGIVTDYVYQPDEFHLTDKQFYMPKFNNPKHKEKLLCREHIYTADFCITFNSKYAEILNSVFKISESMYDATTASIVVWVDIKGAFNRNGGDRIFSVHQKLVYEKFKIFIHKIVPKDFFTQLGIAKGCLKTPTGRASKIYTNYNFIDKVFGLR